MAKIRIGNDITVRWRLTHEGEPYNPNPDKTRLMLRNPFGRLTALTDFAVNGNVVEWVFRGSDQSQTGSYSLTLTENAGEAGMITIDTEAFTLVGRSPIGEQTHCGDVDVETVTLQSDLNMVGLQGKDGHTPQKGIDYWTAEDIAALKESIIADLPQGGSSGSVVTQKELDDYAKLGWDYQTAMYWMSKAEGVEQFKEDVAYSVALYDSVNGVIDFPGFANFYNTRIVYFPQFTFVSAGRLDAFTNFVNLISIPDLDLTSISVMAHTFKYMPHLERIGRLDTRNVRDWAYVFYGLPLLKRIEELDFLSITSMTVTFGYKLDNLRYLLIKNIGRSSLFTYTFDGLNKWGDENITVANMLNKEQSRGMNFRSLYNSLAVYSYDRVAAGLDAVTIKLHADTKARLTDEDLAIITSKGFNITT